MGNASLFKAGLRWFNFAQTCGLLYETRHGGADAENSKNRKQLKNVIADNHGVADRKRDFGGAKQTTGQFFRLSSSFSGLMGLGSTQYIVFSTGLGQRINAGCLSGKENDAAVGKQLHEDLAVSIPFMPGWFIAFVS